MILKMPKHVNRGGQRLIAALAGLLLFTSCNNLFEDPVTPNNTSESSTTSIQTESQPDAAKKYVTVSGSLGLSGAFPAAFASTARTAFPTTPTLASFATTDFEVWAINTTNSDEKYKGSVASDKSSYSVGIPLPDNAETTKSYTIKITAKNSMGICLTGQSPTTSPVTVSLSNPVTTGHDIKLKASQNLGALGRMELSVGIASDSGIHSARVRYEDGVTHCFGVSGESCFFSVGSVDAQGAIEMGIYVGSYPLTFEFFSGALITDDPNQPQISGNLLYSFTETVNIFEHMVTNTWIQNGNEPWFTTTGTGSSKVTTCSVTKAMVDGYVLTEFWVSPSATDDSGSGSFLHPKKTIAGAVAMFHDVNQDYTIYIDGIVTGPQTIPDTLKKTESADSNNYAKSLTICGTTADAKLNGAFTEAGTENTVLNINTEVPVTIKKLTITGGNCNNADFSITYGGGISIGAGADVTLGDGTQDGFVHVTGNKGLMGAGINCKADKLTIKKNVIISNNQKPDGESVSRSGGGIYLAGNCKLYFEGGEISNNFTGDYSASGGGIYIYSGTVFVYGDASIKNNGSNHQYSNGGGIISISNTPVYLGYKSADPLTPEEWTGSISGNKADNGGGVYICGLYMNSGEIYGNSASYSTTSRGGGIFLNNSGGTTSVYLSGTAKIYNNTSTGYGGAFSTESLSSGFTMNLYIQDGVSIPYGATTEAKCKNDVYKCNNNVHCIIKSQLTASAPVATLTTSQTYYSTSTQILEADPTSLLSSEYIKFAVTPQTVNDQKKPWSIGSNGKLKTALGLKTPDAVGDIVLKDGSAISYDYYTNTLTDYEKSVIKSDVVAVIFYKGTACSNDGRTRTLGLGLGHDSVAWCAADASMLESDLTKIKPVSEIEGDETSGDVDGSDNLEKISAYLRANSLTDDTDDPEKYPAFWYCKNYKNVKLGSETTSRIVAGSPLENGWYLPSMAEFYQIYENGPTFNYTETVPALGGSQILNTGAGYYTSSKGGQYIMAANLLNGEWISFTGHQPSSAYVIPIREF